MKIFSKVALIILFVLIAFTLGLVITGIMLEDRIVAMSIAQINKQLNVKIKIKEVKVSLLTGFPKATVKMKGVEIVEGSLDTPKELEPGLLSLEGVDLKFGIIGILKNEYKVDELILKNGWLNFYFDNSGKGNFEIFEKSDSNEASWLLNLDVFRLDNINLSYIDLRTGWIFKGFVDNANIKGAFSNNQTLLSIKANGAVGSLRQGEFFYIRNQKVTINTDFLISPSGVLIDKSLATVGETKFTIQGSYGREKGDHVLLNVSGADLDVKTLISFLSQHNFSLPQNTISQGKIKFSLEIKGLTKTETPFNLNLNFGSDMFRLDLPNYPPIVMSQLSGNFTNGSLGNAETSEIRISNMTLETGNSKLQGTLKLKNINTPLYHLKLNQHIDIKDLFAWGVDLPILEGQLNGSVEALGIINDISNITVSSFENSKFYSSLTLSNLALKNVGRIPDLSSISGVVNINNQDITSAKLRGLLYGSNFAAEVQASNALGILFGNKKAIVNASITIDSLNTNWLFEDNQQEAPSDSGQSTWDRIESISGDVFIDELVHNKFVSTPLSANFYLKSDQFFSNSFLSRSCNGIFTGRLSSHTKGNNYYIISADIDVDGVEIDQLFNSFNNFDQQSIISSNISGKVDGSILFSTPIINGRVVKEDFEANADLKISDGRLKNVKQLENLSKFIELEELKDIKFSAIQNSIRVNNQQVIIPQMDIESSALNLSLSGTHSFNGDYLYRFQLLLSDVLYSKASSKKPENISFGEVEDDGSGKTKLYLKLEGDVNSHKVSYDGAAARNAFRENLKQERQSLKNILLDEFKFLRKEKADTSIVNKQVNPSSTIQKKGKDTLETKKDNPKYVIEWDDE
ncbi:MAG: hypothetical protein CVT98_00090 [Bacteroidetes bacterium HGW-Bacteroidetes-15]|nr:MAG: hypothetical protein CVT98_00090 [Bacteroidetes bacterium HGW-Bacteroidetes-15]